jgi:acetolactate synthase I/II/III large subunit
LAAALAAAPVLGDWSDWQKKGRAGFLAMRENATQTGAVNMVEICAWLRQNLDDDCIITNGAGNFAIWPSKFLDFGHNRRLLAPQSGAMGAGLPAAIAAKTVDPARQVLCFAGDGDIQMTLAELGTAAQENLRPIILVLNNGMYGTIRAHQEKHYPNRVSATKIVNPDFVTIAKAYGFHGERVSTTAEFVPAFQRAKVSAQGAIVEIMIDPEDISPFSSIAKIRGTGRV